MKGAYVPLPLLSAEEHKIGKKTKKRSVKLVIVWALPGLGRVNE